MRNINTLGPNHYTFSTDDGTYFQSYDSVIAFRDFRGKITLDEHYWDYSMTTGKYRNMFLGETKQQTQRKIDNGEYTLADLNMK